MGGTASCTVELQIDELVGLGLFGGPSWLVWFDNIRRSNLTQMNQPAAAKLFNLTSSCVVWKLAPISPEVVAHTEGEVWFNPFERILARSST